MEIKIKQNELEVQLKDKVVKLQGHQDMDAFSLFTESLETNLLLSQNDINEIRLALKRRDDIIER